MCVRRLSSERKPVTEMSLERLELDVALKLVFVQTSLAKVEEYRQHLQENAQKMPRKNLLPLTPHLPNHRHKRGYSSPWRKSRHLSNIQPYSRPRRCRLAPQVKDEIHEIVERQIGALRGRERQLIRQVEVVTAHQTCLLGTQQAGLMQGEGVLLATRDLLLRCTEDDTSTFAKIKVDDMDCLNDVVPVDCVSVQLDEAALSSAVSKFGRVQLPDTITHHPSPVIPAKVEEYEDDEHDVLHKSVAGAASGPDSPVRITVQFPRLANQNWLARQKDQDSGAMPSSKISSIGAGPKTCDITSWLSGLQLAGAQEDDVATTRSTVGSFDMLAMNSPVHSTESSSIEIVPSRCDTEKDICSTPGSGMYELENIHMHVGDKSRWLSNKSTHSDDHLLQHINIASVCRANETCGSFNDCLCQSKCKETAVEKIQQSINYRMKTGRKRTRSESERTACSSVLAYMTNVLASENDLWLLQKQSANSVVPVPIKRAMYEAPGGNWLRLGQSTPTNQTPRIKLATHSNIWLLRKFKSQKDKMSNEKDEKDIENGMDEKESRITTEALSEALKKVSIDSSTEAWDRSSTSGNPPTTDTSKVSHTQDVQSWLLSKKQSSNQHIRDNKMEESEVFNKAQWLSCSSDSSPVKRKLEALTPPRLPESVLSVAQAGINSWLLKSFY
ncbi:uncharacterized protein [Procambarus clarkii]|uniref:uncharacterized protein isoform X3 n=1 Tax=Procambarus clarkii TaxID=6728 RepID=UPI003743B3E3